MNVSELTKDPTIKAFIEKLVRDPSFLVLKDAFVSHSPNGHKEGVEVAHGMFLGTRYVFNELETISKTIIPPKTTTKDQGRAAGKDPDLDDGQDDEN